MNSEPGPVGKSRACETQPDVRQSLPTPGSDAADAEWDAVKKKLLQLPVSEAGLPLASPRVVLGERKLLIAPPQRWLKVRLFAWFVLIAAAVAGGVLLLV